MAKIIEATCVGGVVKVGEIVISNAKILSEGVGESEGILIIDEDLCYYVVSSALDIKDAIEKISEMLTSIKTLFTNIGTGMTGPTTAPPPTLATDLAALQVKITALETLGEGLR